MRVGREADRYHPMSLVKTEQTYKLELLRLRLRKSQHSCRFSDQGIPRGQVIESRERTSSTKCLSFSPSILDLQLSPLSAAPFSSTFPPLLAACHQVLSKSLLYPALLARISTASSQGFHFQFHAPYLHWSDLPTEQTWPCCLLFKTLHSPHGS